jgi:type III pantothenate kinase
MTRAGENGGRTLVLNIGNTTLFAGVYAGARLQRSVRCETTGLVRLAQLGSMKIERAAVCSVVPAMLPDALRLIRRTWGVEAKILTGTSKHGLKIAYPNPGDMGPDRVAASLGAASAFPRRNVVIVDCGTATTVTALRKDGCVLGGAIMPGLGLWAEMLAQRTALLPRVAVSRPPRAIGRSPRAGIVSGCYFGHAGAVRELIGRVRREAFGAERALVIGTGGNLKALEREKLFDLAEPTLVLRGLRCFAEQI